MSRKPKDLLLNSCFAFVIGLSSVLVPAVANAAEDSSSIQTRIGGVDQYETAALMAEKGWPEAADSVVLSAGMSNNLVDALAAGPLAAKLKAPILLTGGGDSLNSFTKAELERLKPKKVYITSGTAVIKPAAVEEIKGLGITPVPLGGHDQYETSVNIAKEMISLGANPTQVVVAAGWMAPVDALSVSSIAADLEIPILATTRDTLPASVKDFLSAQTGITDSYVIGGTAVVGDGIKAALPGAVHRFSGLTKYDTNLEVLKGFANDVHYETVYVANGDTFVDALSGVPLAAFTHSPIVLSQSEWSPEMKAFLKYNKSGSIVALGGAVAVPENVLKPLSEISNNAPPATTEPVTPAAGGGAPAAGGAAPPVPVTPTVPTTGTVTISGLQVFTSPANSLGTVDNGGVIDLTGLDNSVKVLGFGLTADQDCTLQFDVLGSTQSISLTAGQPKTVTVQDLILGQEVEGVDLDSVDLGTFRLLYQTKVLTGKLLREGTSVGSLTVTLKFKN